MPSVAVYLQDGFQEYYIRAYDAQKGNLVWQYALPVGSGDYVMAFSLPEPEDTAAET